MEAATLPGPAAAEATPQPDPTPSLPEATRTVESLFQYSDYVNIGRGAIECEHAETGQCQDPQHFHGFVTLPNAFQMRDIMEKAEAARAIKRRALRDPGTESYAILEAALDEVVEDRDGLVGEVAERRLERDFSQLVTDFSDREEWKLQGQHAEEYQRQAALSEEERNPEEYAQLEAALKEYGDALSAEIDQAREREAAKLRVMDTEKLREMARRGRISQITQQAYLNAYYMWCMFACTYVPGDETPKRRAWETTAQLKSAPPEVVSAVRRTIAELEVRMQRGDAAGNS